MFISGADRMNGGYFQCHRSAANPLHSCNRIGPAAPIRPVKPQDQKNTGNDI